MPTPAQLSRQGLIKEIYVSAVGWIWVAVSLAAVYFLIKAIFFGGAWWPFIASAAGAWLFYKVSLYYLLEHQGLPAVKAAAYLELTPD